MGKFVTVVSRYAIRVAIPRDLEGFEERIPDIFPYLRQTLTDYGSGMVYFRVENEKNPNKIASVIGSMLNESRPRKQYK